MPTEFFKLLGNENPAASSLGDMTQGLGYPLRPVEASTTGGTVNIINEDLIVSESLADQAPTAVDTPYQINYGAGDSSPQVTVDAAGNITFLEAGDYIVSFRGTLGRIKQNATAVVFMRGLLNSAEFPPISFVIVMPDNDVAFPVNLTFNTQFQVNDVLTIEMYRDSAGENDGSLFAVIPSLAGWEQAPSAAILISRTVAVAT
jgi:hypothetical protein